MRIIAIINLLVTASVYGQNELPVSVGHRASDAAFDKLRGVSDTQQTRTPKFGRYQVFGPLWDTEFGACEEDRSRWAAEMQVTGRQYVFASLKYKREFERLSQYPTQLQEEMLIAKDTYAQLGGNSSNRIVTNLTAMNTRNCSSTLGSAQLPIFG